MVYAQSRICLREWDAQAPLGFWDTNLGQTTRFCHNQQKKRSCRIVNFAVPTDHREKLKKAKKRISTKILQRDWKKKLWNMKVTIIPSVIGVLDTVTKGLVQELEDLETKGRVETIKTTALFIVHWTARILRRVLEAWGVLLLLKLQ